MRRGLALRCARALLLGLLALATTGCVQELARAPGDWRTHVAELRAQERWQLQGKIGVRAERQGGSAFLSWRQQAGDYRLVLSGALGLGKLVLNGDASGVRWTDEDGTPRHHPDPEHLIAEAWGWRVPVAALQYWVRGIPSPASGFEDARFENGLPVHFRQAGWVVEPAAYRLVDGFALPTRVRVSDGEAVLTVSINRWEFGGS